MPPRANSRHGRVDARVEQATQRLMLGERAPVRYVDRADNRTHVVRSGDTLWNIAARYFASLASLPGHSAAMLYWIIMDYQPTPIHDPTIRLAEGSVLVVPSVSFVVDSILAR